MLDTYFGKASRHLLPEPPMGCCSAVVEKSGLGEQKSTYAHSAQTSYFCCHLLQPRGQGGITNGPAPQPAHQEYRIASALDLLEAMLREKGEKPTFSLDVRPVCIGHNFDGIDLAAGQTIDRVEYLQRADQVEFVNRRYDDNHDPAACGLALQLRLLVHGCHGMSNYAADRT